MKQQSISHSIYKTTAAILVLLALNSADALAASEHKSASKARGGQSLEATAVRSSTVDRERSRIDLNRASEQELQLLRGVGPGLARRIIRYRHQHGRFSSIEELMRVKGIGPKLLEKNRALLGLK